MNRKIHFLIAALAAAAFCFPMPRARAESAKEAAQTAKEKAAAAEAADKAAKEAQEKADAAEKKDAEKKGKEWKKSEADQAADDAAKAADDAAKEADDAKDKAEKAKEDADAAKKDADNAGKSDEAKQDKAKKAAEEAAAAKAEADAAENGRPPSTGPGPSLPGSGGTSGATGSKGEPAKPGKPDDSAEGKSKEADAKAEAADKKETDNREVQRLKKEAREARRKARRPHRAARDALRRLAAAIAEAMSKAGTPGKPPPSPLEGPIKDLEELKKKTGAINLPPPPPGSAIQLAQLIADGSVTATVSGTGETIGHVADVTLKNLTAQPLNVSIPPTLLIPSSGERQPYALTDPHGGTVGAGETATIPLDGVCLDARKPPVTPSDTVGLAIADPNTLSQPLRDQLAGAQRVMTAARALQAAGKFKTPFSGNPAKERATIVQWTTWVGVAQMTGNPLTKADFAEKVYQQAGVPTVADGLVQASFTVPQGKIKVYLPSDMAAGDTMSGTVAAEPKGGSPEEQKKNTEALNGYVIDVAGYKGPVSTRTITGVVPGSFAANPTLVLADAQGATVKSTSLPQPSKPGKKTEAPATSDFQLPTNGRPGHPLEIRGSFDGNASNTNVTIGGQELPVLAESQSRVVVQTPSALAGPAEIVVKEGARDTKGTYANKTAAEVVSAQKTSSPKSQPAGTQQQKLDKGVNDLWNAIQLTGVQAKVL